MNDKNPIFSEEINRTKTPPLVEFLWLSFGAIILIVIVTVVLFYSIHWAAPYIPFSIEQKLAEKVISDSSEKDSNEIDQKEIYLQQLVEQLSIAQKVPGDMPITAHWMDSDMVNAFATLGGNVFITKGLWEKMPSENALAMVVAHEIAHVKHRDPLKSLSAGLMLAFITQMIFGENSTGMSLIGGSGLITSLHFTRAMETEADREAIETLNNHYGHVAGSTDFFEIILEEEQGEQAHLEFLQTHPLTHDRIAQLRKLQLQNNWLSDKKAIKQLP
ncbi:MAG: M48 family metallopeptidase [Gammaproteobacteria bacterium]